MSIEKARDNLSRAEQITGTLHEVLTDERQFDIGHRSLGRLECSRSVDVIGGSRSRLYEITERFLQTGILRKLTTNSFQIGFLDNAKDNKALGTTFTYLPYRDQLLASRELVDFSNVDENGVVKVDRENYHRELMSGFLEPTADDWGEFMKAIDDIKRGEVVDDKKD